MAGKKIELGPTGRVVAERIRAYREGKNLTWTQLAKRMSECGRPITAIALRRIEDGERRVDVDDLLALAYTLEVNPHALLFPRLSISDGIVETVEVSGLSKISGETLWEWADGERPLYDPTEDPRAFTGRTRPSWKYTVDHDAADKLSLRRELDDLRLKHYSFQEEVTDLIGKMREQLKEDHGND